MTGALDTRARATAERMIDKFGKAMTLRREVVGTYDPSTGAAAVVPTDYAVVGVVTQPSVAMLSAGLAQGGDLVVMLAAQATDVVPQAGDVLVMNLESWQVMSVRSMFSGELVATYELLARS
jgi:hypothetical protein